MTVHSPETPTRPTRALPAAANLGIAIGAVWLGTMLIAGFSPDLVTGSQHEHLPIAGITAWVWAVIATAYLASAARGRSISAGSMVATVVIWFAAVLGALAAPVLVTGTDPTRIPIVSILVPVLAAFATGFVAVHEARTA